MASLVTLERDGSLPCQDLFADGFAGGALRGRL